MVPVVPVVPPVSLSIEKLCEQNAIQNQEDQKEKQVSVNFLYWMLFLWGNIFTLACDSFTFVLYWANIEFTKLMKFNFVAPFTLLLFSLSICSLLFAVYFVCFVYLKNRNHLLGKKVPTEWIISKLLITSIATAAVEFMQTNSNQILVQSSVLYFIVVPHLFIDTLTMAANFYWFH